MAAKSAILPSMRFARVTLTLIAVLTSAGVNAGQLTIAVASNFRVAAEEIVAMFGRSSGVDVRISSASTGKLFTQISNGAPFDVFLAADSMHPKLLEQNGLAIAGSRATYAIGSLVLWSQEKGLKGSDCRAALDNLGRSHLAIANPEIAPYGAAARQFLEAADLWAQVTPNLVYGENIAQALHFVASGNAKLGLIARSQALDSRLPEPSCSWPVPHELHDPIEQQLVVLQSASDKTAATAFVEFLDGPAARATVVRYGYGVSE